MLRASPPPLPTKKAPASLGWTGIVAICLFAVTAFAPAVHNEYAGDDIRQVKNYVVPRTPGAWLTTPLEPWWVGTQEKFVWRPLARLTIAVQKTVHADVPAGLYAFNIVLHAFVAVMLAALAQQLGWSRHGAFATGMLFATHPVHCESVHQIVGRTELLAAAAMLVGAYLFVRGGGLANPSVWWQQATCFALALAAKEHAILYPGFLALLIRDDPSTRGRSLRDRLLSSSRRAHALLGLLSGVALLYFAARLLVTGGWLESHEFTPHFENPLASRSFLERLPAVLGIFAYAASRLLVPTGLSPDYSAVALPLDLGFRWVWTWAGLALVAGLGWIALRSARRGGRVWVLVASAVSAFAITSNGPFPIGTVTAERLWLMPSVFACLGLGALVGIAERALHARRLALVRGRIPLVLAGTLALGFTAQARTYGQSWRNSTEMARATLARFPRSFRGHVNLALADYEAGRFASGRRHGRTATLIEPNRAEGWQALGVNEMRIAGATYEAEAALRRALWMDSTRLDVHRYLAFVLETRGDPEGAAAELGQYLSGPAARDRSMLEARVNRLRAAATPFARDALDVGRRSGEARSTEIRSTRGARPMGGAVAPPSRTGSRATSGRGGVRAGLLQEGTEEGR